MKGYSYTSTPPMGRTACTESQCLYKGVLKNVHKNVTLKNTGLQNFAFYAVVPFV